MAIKKHRGQASLITIFTTPKPFVGLFEIIQQNALASWREIDPAVQIIVFGDEGGAAENAAEFGATHIPQVRLSPHGTPLLSDMFLQASGLATNDRICYVNADIALFSDLVDASRAVRFDDFLMVGRRMNLNVSERIDFTDVHERTATRIRATVDGQLFTPFGIDYFVLPRHGSVRPLDFPVGRAMWDNWMIFQARKTGVPVIDATDAVLALHQNHDYSHISGGRAAAYTGAEVKSNWELVGQGFYRFSIDEADWKLDPDLRVEHRGIFRRPARRAFSNVVLWPGGPALVKLARKGKQVVRPAEASPLH